MCESRNTAKLKMEFSVNLIHLLLPFIKEVRSPPYCCLVFVPEKLQNDLLKEKYSKEFIVRRCSDIN